MKKLLLISLCMPVLFSCGEYEKSEEKDNRIFIDELTSKGDQFIGLEPWNWNDEKWSRSFIKELYGERKYTLGINQTKYYYKGNLFTGYGFDVNFAGDIIEEGYIDKGLKDGLWIRKNWAGRNLEIDFNDGDVRKIRVTIPDSNYLEGTYSYKDGKKNGEDRYYKNLRTFRDQDEMHSALHIVNWKEGVKDGLEQITWSNQQLFYQGEYKEGKRVGAHLRWDFDGTFWNGRFYNDSGGFDFDCDENGTEIIFELDELPDF